MGKPVYTHQALSFRFTKMWLLMAAFLLTVTWSWGISSQLSELSDNQTIGGQVIIQHLLVFAIMLGAWRELHIKLTPQNITLVLISGIAARLLLLLIDPYTSNDVDRYLFDGRILLQGLDPYQISHDAPVLQDLRAQWQPPAEHAKYTTLYPPLALTLYSLAAGFGIANALLVWKLITSIASIALYLLTYKFLKKLNRLQFLPFVALSPILIFEAGEAAHIDVFSGLAVIAAVYAFVCQRASLVGLFIGLGACVKILPIILLLPLFFFVKTKLERTAMLFTAIATWASVYVIAVFSGLKPVGSITIFFAKWRASSPWFNWLEPSLGITGMLYATMAAALLGLAIITLASYRARDANIDQQITIMQYAIALPLVISPVVFPWYLMPLAVLFALKPNWTLALWMISFSLSYEVLNQFLCCAIWQPAQWATNAIGVSLLLGLTVSLLLAQTRNKKRKTA